MSKKYANDRKMIVQELNSLTINPYWDRSHERKDKEQISWHRDCLYSWNKPHEFCPSNSQAQQSPTCILSLGETRTINFRCCRHRLQTDPRYPKGPIPIPESYQQFDLTHGSLLVLHPDDEETVLREIFDEKHCTFMQHGAIMFGEAGLSVALAFRDVVNVKEVFRNNGLAIPTKLYNLIQQQMKAGCHKKQENLAEKIEKEKADQKKRIEIVEEHIKNKAEKEEFDNYKRSLYLEMKHKFTKQNTEPN